jgi:hypothetical protein
MKLLSHEYGQHSVELTFADADDESEAKTVLIARIPYEAKHTKSLVYNRYWALNALHDKLGELLRAERELMESGR